MTQTQYEIVTFRIRIGSSNIQTLSTAANLTALFNLGGSFIADGKKIEENQAHLCHQNDIALATDGSNAEILGFSLCTKDGAFDEAENIEIVSRDAIDVQPGNWICRVDSVIFPPGSMAYRHHHAGAGTRWLKSGTIEIHSDHGMEIMQTGDAWFEDALSPVVAVPSKVIESRFIRILILPTDYKGKPTITYLNPEDNEKPKTQKNERYLDEEFKLL